MAVGGRARRDLGAAHARQPPAAARELAAGLDERIRALGERMAASPQPWPARQLGVLAPGVSPELRGEYTAARA